MMFYNTPQEDASYIWNEAKKGDRVAKKLLDYYKKTKRKKKIQKLQSNDSHWSGLN